MPISVPIKKQRLLSDRALPTCSTRHITGAARVFECEEDRLNSNFRTLPCHDLPRYELAGDCVTPTNASSDLAALSALSSSTAAIVDEYGRLIPIASIAEDIYSECTYQRTTLHRGTPCGFESRPRHWPNFGCSRERCRSQARTREPCANSQMRERSGRRTR